MTTTEPRRRVAGRAVARAGVLATAVALATADLTYAQAAPAAGGSPAGMTSLFANMFPILMMFVIFYFLLFRPQQKKAAEMKKMLQNLQKGDRVVTQGGMHGTVVGIHDDIAVLRVAEDVKIEFAKSSIVGVVSEKK